MGRFILDTGILEWITIFVCVRKPSRSFSRVHGWFRLQTQSWEEYNKIMLEHVCVCVNTNLRIKWILICISTYGTCI